MLRVAEEQSEEELRDSLSQLNERILQLNLRAGELGAEIRATKSRLKLTAKKLQQLAAEKSKKKELSQAFGNSHGRYEGWRGGEHDTDNTHTTNRI